MSNNIQAEKVKKALADNTQPAEYYLNGIPAADHEILTIFVHAVAKPFNRDSSQSLSAAPRKIQRF